MYEDVNKVLMHSIVEFNVDLGKGYFPVHRRTSQRRIYNTFLVHLLQCLT